MEKKINLSECFFSQILAISLPQDELSSGRASEKVGYGGTFTRSLVNLCILTGNLPQFRGWRNFT